MPCRSEENKRRVHSEARRGRVSGNAPSGPGGHGPWQGFGARGRPRKGKGGGGPRAGGLAAGERRGFPGELDGASQRVVQRELRGDDSRGHAVWPAGLPFHGGDQAPHGEQGAAEDDEAEAEGSKDQERQKRPEEEDEHPPSRERGRGGGPRCAERWRGRRRGNRLRRAVEGRGQAHRGRDLRCGRGLLSPL